jgi:hypothetical protein
MSFSPCDYFISPSTDTFDLGIAFPSLRVELTPTEAPFYVQKIFEDSGLFFAAKVVKNPVGAKTKQVVQREPIRESVLALSLCHGWSWSCVSSRIWSQNHDSPICLPVALWLRQNRFV